MSGKSSYSKGNNSGGNGNGNANGNGGGGGGSGGGSVPNNQQSRYQRQMQGKQGGQGKQGQSSTVRVQGQLEKSVKFNADRDAMRIEGDVIDSKFGFDRMKEGPDR